MLKLGPAAHHRRVESQKEWKKYSGDLTLAAGLTRETNHSGLLVKVDFIPCHFCFSLLKRELYLNKPESAHRIAGYGQLE